MPAQGNALGQRAPNDPSPEGAAQPASKSARDRHAPCPVLSKAIYDAIPAGEETIKGD